jgi:hypothetical protein
MTDHEARIALPIAAVHQAWRRYVGYGGEDAEHDGGRTWSAVDGSGLRAEFVSEAPELTRVSTHRDRLPDAVPEAGAQTLSEFVEGFVAYLESAFDELERHPGARSGTGLAGPDGTSHTHDGPRQLP